LASSNSTDAAGKTASDGRASSRQTVFALIATTCVAAGGGGLLGLNLAGVPEARPSGEEGRAASVAAKAPAAKAHDGAAHGEHAGGGGEEAAPEQSEQPSLRLQQLAPIVTNLSSPETSWIRLQGAIVYDAKALPHPEIVVAELTSDIVAFLRTISLSSIEGADGLRRLREDLNERVAIRSEGHVREFIILALVVQ
jgi:hypothetical protein